MNFFRLLSDKANIQLNEQQKKAVQHVDGPALVLAGPGSGKTTVIISRLAYLIIEAGINPANILSMTFNKAAAQEMEYRFSNSMGQFVEEKIRFSTLHAFSYSILRDYQRVKNINFTLIEGTDDRLNKRNILKDIYLKTNHTMISDDEMEDLINEIGFVKNKMLPSLEEYKSSVKNFRDIFTFYENFKSEKYLIDFDDMLTHSYNILKKEPKILEYYRNRYRYIQIDEGQDVSKIQLEIISLLSKPLKNVFVVADDDQSIYGFRGAEPQYLIDFNKYFTSPEVYMLETNYRSSRNIVDVSSFLIKRNVKRYDKNHSTNNSYFQDPQIIEVENEYEQIEFLIEKISEILKVSGKKADISILYRNNLSSVLIAEALQRKNIEFYLKDSKLFFFSHWFVLDILAFIRFSMNQNDEEAFQRIYYKMNRYISKSMMEYAFNVTGGKTILDRVLKYEDLKYFQKEKLIDLKAEFNSFSRSTPLQALKYIENSFRYLDNAKDYCDKCGYSFDYILDLFSIIKGIAEGCQTLTAFLQRMDNLQILLSKSGGNKSKVTLSTVHSAKGLEYDHVFMVNLYDGEFPGRQSLDSIQRGGNYEMLEEERRLFYVAVTRARKHLYLICPKARNEEPAVKSLFVREIERYYEEKLLEDIDEGLIIQHKVYGRGIVVGLYRNASNEKLNIKVDFSGSIKLLDLRLCMEKGIINF